MWDKGMHHTCQTAPAQHSLHRQPDLGNCCKVIKRRQRSAILLVQAARSQSFPPRGAASQNLESGPKDLRAAHGWLQQSCAIQPGDQKCQREARESTRLLQPSSLPSPNLHSRSDTIY